MMILASIVVTVTIVMIRYMIDRPGLLLHFHLDQFGIAHVFLVPFMRAGRQRQAQKQGSGQDWQNKAVRFAGHVCHSLACRDIQSYAPLGVTPQKY
jgi:hypothetical protein